MTANWTQSRMISWVSYFWSCSPLEVLYSITAHLTQQHQLTQLTQTQHLSTGSLTATAGPINRDTVTMTMSHLFPSSAEQAQTGMWEQEEDIHPFLQTHTHTHTSDVDSKRLLHWKPPILPILLRLSSWCGLLWIWIQSTDRLLSHMMPSTMTTTRVAPPTLHPDFWFINNKASIIQFHDQEWGTNYLRSVYTETFSTSQQNKNTPFSIIFFFLNPWIRINGKALEPIHTHTEYMLWCTVYQH